MANFFGGKDPFFTQPFGGWNPFDDPFFTRPSGNKKQVTIEELNTDDGSNDSWQKNNKPVYLKNSNEFPTGPGVQSFSYQRVAYGGTNGVYYTSSVGKRTGGDEVFLMEMKEEDCTVGESLHTVSKGIHDKGHSVTTKQSSDGQIDSLQTLHNLNQDELAGFEDNWKSNADKVLVGWSDGFENSGFDYRVWDDFANWSGFGGWPLLPSSEYYGADDDAGEPPSRKIIPVE